MGWSLIINSIKPWHTYDDGVSPGCTRAVTITTFFRFPFTNNDGFATVNRSSRRFCYHKHKQKFEIFKNKLIYHTIN